MNINKFYDTEATDDGIDEIFDYIDDNLLAGNFHLVDDLLASIDCERLCSTYIVSFASITSGRAKSKLKNREAFIRKAKSCVRDGLLDNLE